MTDLMDRSLVVRLRSLAVVRKRAGRGEVPFIAPGAAKEPRMRGPGRALSSNIRAICCSFPIVNCAGDRSRMCGCLNPNPSREWWEGLRGVSRDQVMRGH